MEVSVTRSGPSIQSKLIKLRLKMQARIEPALLAAGEVLLEESLKIVPRDTEALAHSADCRLNEKGEAIVGYGPPDFIEEGVTRDGKVVVRRPADYALHVHENLSMQHQPGEFAEFLTSPIQDKGEEIAQAFNQNLR